MKKHTKLISYFFLFAILIFSGLFLSSCSFIQGIFGGGEGGSGNDFNISGNISIGFQAGYSGKVIIGFVEDNTENPPSPIPWANFEGSHKEVGDYNGQPNNYDFSFENIPEGKYYLIAIVDTNNNGGLDLSEDGNAIEPCGFYPTPGEEGPIPKDFKGDESNVAINMYPGGIAEDFEDGNANNWVPDDSNWRVENYSDTSNKVYKMIGSIADYNKRNSYYDCTFNCDYDFSAEVAQGAGGAQDVWGIFFRVQDPWNIYNGDFSGYTLEMDASSNFYVKKYDNGSSTEISSINLGYSVGNFNKLEVVCHDNSYDIYINNELVDELCFTDSTYQDGYVGLFAEDSGQTEEIDFDNINLSILY